MIDRKPMVPGLGSDQQTSKSDVCATVVVPVRNARADVIEQLDALAGQTIVDRLEIFIVDDASTDGTAAVVDEWIRQSPYRNFKLVSRRRRGGPNAARNDGLCMATFEWVLFCDGDDVAAPDWAEQLLSEVHDNAVLAGFCPPIGIGTTPSRTSAEPPRSFGWPYAPGGNAAVGLEHALSIGGFDENIVAGGTEVDFAIRAQSAGARIVQVPAAVIRYRVLTDARSSFRREFARERGLAYIARRHRGIVDGQRSWRSYPRALTRVAVGAALLVATRRTTPGHVASLAGRAAGWPFWWCRFRLRMPQPRLLDPRQTRASS